MQRSKLITVYTLFVLTGFYPTLASSQVSPNWEELCSLKHARHLHRAAYVGNNKILVFGGYVESHGILNGEATATTEIIDYVTGEVVDGPDMAASRVACTYEVDNDGDLIVIGGRTTSVERFDIQTFTWQPVGKLIERRWQHASAWISADEILVVGGWQSKTAEILNVRTGESRRVADFFDEANSMRALTPKGQVPLFWGYRQSGAGSDRDSRAARYDVVSDKWTNTLDFGIAVAFPVSLTLQNGSSFVSGGATGESPFQCSRLSFIVDSTGTLKTAPEVLQGRQHQGAIEWTPGVVLIAGGIGDSVSWLNSTEFVDIITGVTSTGPRMRNVHAFTQLVSVPSEHGTAAVIVSGLDSSIQNTPIVEILKPKCPATTVRTIKPHEYRLRGAAHVNGAVLELTDTSTYQSGAAWLKSRIKVDAGFQVDFGFTLSEGDDHSQQDGGPAGADGVAFVLQNSTESPLGESGRGIGYDGIFHGLAVEFDSYKNGAFSDPAGSHVAVQLGDGMRLRASHTAPFVVGSTYTGIPQFKADGTTYHCRVVYRGGYLSVYVSTEQHFTNACLTVPLKLADLKLDPDGTTWAGFTSATGFSTERHVLNYVEFTGCGDVVLSVNDFQKSDQPKDLTVIPTPASNSVLIEFPRTFSGTAVVRDIAGRELHRQQLNDSESVEFDVRSLSMGVYSVTVIPDNAPPLSSLLIISR